MSKQINPDAPLSDEDRAWMNANGREAEARAHDARHGIEAPAGGHITGSEPSLGTGVQAGSLAQTPGLSPTQIAVAMGDKQMLLASFSDAELYAELERREQEAEGGDDDTVEASRATSEVVREGEEGVPDYDDWKADTLRAQLGVRELSKSGLKSDLVDRLRDDDSDQA
jgi:hypothetical protein